MDDSRGNKWERKDVPFEIRERTFQFAVRVTKLARQMPRTLDAVEIGRQLIRSGTSVGANVEEAHGAESQCDFVHKMSIARKEARECIFSINRGRCRAVLLTAAWSDSKSDLHSPFSPEY